MKIYKKSFLDQVVCEIRFLPELYIEGNKNLFYDRIKNEYPLVLLPYPDSSSPNSLQPYRFDSADQHKSVIFSIDKITYIERKYNGFEAFKPNAIKYLEMFCDIYKIKDLVRLGLRYVNIIPIVVEKGGSLPIGEYLNFSLNLPEEISANKIKQINANFITEFNGGHLRIHIAQQKSEALIGESAILKHGLLLDFDYVVSTKFSSKSIDNYIEEAHKHTKLVFNKIITEKYEKILMEE